MADRTHVKSHPRQVASTASRTTASRSNGGIASGSTDTAAETAAQQSKRPKQQHGQSSSRPRQGNDTAHKRPQQQQHGTVSGNNITTRPRTAAANRSNKAAASQRHGSGKIEKWPRNFAKHPQGSSLPLKLSTPPRKIQWTSSGKTIQISRYDRRLNNMRHQGTHDDCTIDGDAPTIDDDVTMRQEKSSGRLVPKSSGGQGPVQD
ncbi:hypothetical protein Ae201684P_009136 [Aphanomyces euteiches]|nr:hypothetical protein Ae201684P_009136 [Aphanomyces euteiches]